MQTVFIFTHLVMISAVLLILYNGFGIEAKETGRFHSTDSIWPADIFKRVKMLRCRMKARVVLISDRISSLKIPIRLNGRLEDE